LVEIRETVEEIIIPAYITGATGATHFESASHLC